MNFEWMSNPIAIYGVLAAGCIAALHLVISTKIEMRRQHKLHQAESETLREALADLEEKLKQVSLPSKHVSPAPIPYTPSTGLNPHKRAEALRMYRHGSDRETISNALGLKQAEAALLETVHNLLTSSAA